MFRWTDDSLIHSEASAESVAMLRFWVFGLCAARATMPLAAFGDVPAEAFSTYGFFRLMPGQLLSALLSPPGLVLLQSATVVLCGMAALGLVTRLAAVGGTASLVLFEGTARGFMGFVNHAQIPLILACVILTLSPIDHALTLWPRRQPRRSPGGYQWPLVAILALLCLGYLFIGAHRLAYGGLELFRSESLRQWILYWNLTQADPLSTPGGWLTTHPSLMNVAKASFPLITLLEISAPLCVISTRWRRLFVPAMLSVHLGIFIFMRINFVELALLYVVFIDSRRWSPTYLPEGTRSILYFDGVCGLCNRFVDFLIRHDRREQLQFAPLQGTTAMAELGSLPSSELTTVVLVEREAQTRSDAVLGAVSRLGGLWPILTVLGLVPRVARDAVYDWVARSRYRWFGVLAECRLPSPAERERFLP